MIAPRKLQLGLTGLLWMSASLGALGLLLAPPLEILSGSVLHRSPVPALVLLLVVGGSAMSAAILTFMNDPRAPAASIFAGMMLLAFLAVELLVIGSPPGAARIMQPLFVFVGLGIVTLGVTDVVTHRERVP